MDGRAFLLRSATADDAALIAQHRARMWQDMGDLPGDLYAQMLDCSAEGLHAALRAGEYVGWLAAPADAPETIIAGAGIHLRRVLPFPLKQNGQTVRLAQGRLGTIVNVFTEPEWRRRGVAFLLLQTMIEWARTAPLDRLNLHAAPDARRLYERAGFQLVLNEMRLPLV